MSKVNDLREKIAEKASIIYGVKVKASNVAAIPITKKDRRYTVVVYDNNLDALCESEPAEYTKAFEGLLKKLSRAASRA